MKGQRIFLWRYNVIAEVLCPGCATFNNVTGVGGAGRPNKYMIMRPTLLGLIVGAHIWFKIC